MSSFGLFAVVVAAAAAVVVVVAVGVVAAVGSLEMARTSGTNITKRFSL